MGSCRYSFAHRQDTCLEQSCRTPPPTWTISGMKCGTLRASKSLAHQSGHHSLFKVLSTRGWRTRRSCGMPFRLRPTLANPILANPFLTNPFGQPIWANPILANPFLSCVVWAMFYLGQSYLGQFLLRPVLLGPGSTWARFYLGQFYLG